MDAFLGDDRGDELGGRDVEGRVVGREPRRDLARVALLDRDGGATSAVAPSSVEVGATT